MNRARAAKMLLALALGPGVAIAQVEASPSLRARIPARVPASAGVVPGPTAPTMFEAVPGEGSAAATPGPAAAPAPRAQPPSTITIPEGTRILLALQSPLHTTSAQDSAGVYAEVVSPVVGDGRVLIPVRTQVQGVVESGKRPGRVRGRAQLLLRFTTMIFPNNYVVSLDGGLQGVPGSSRLRTRKGQGPVEPVDQIDKDVQKVFFPSLAGAAIGSVRSLGPGTFTGAGAGAAFGLLHVLVTRGDEIRLMPGTTLEMVLRGPLTLEAGRIP